MDDADSNPPSVGMVNLFRRIVCLSCFLRWRSNVSPYTDYVVDRLSTCVNTLSRLDSTELDVDEVEIIDHYQSLLNQLLELIRDIASEWHDLL